MINNELRLQALEHYRRWHLNIAKLTGVVWSDLRLLVVATSTLPSDVPVYPDGCRVVLDGTRYLATIPGGEFWTTILD